MRLLFLAMLLVCSSTAQAIDLGALGAVLNSATQPTATNATRPASAQPAPAASSATPSAAGLGQFTAQAQADSLKQALTQGVGTAVASLAKANGYLGNPQVRIPLPENLQRAEQTLRRMGMGFYADDLIATINRAAEAAAPEAKALLVGAVKKMTVNDAKDILLGQPDAATQYFRLNTTAALSEKFKPIIGQSMQKVSLTKVYDRFAGKAAMLGLIDPQDAVLQDYITRKALDGLFVMMAEQEKQIRANPAQASGDLARKVFTSLLGK